jgi:hypothetical protein
MSSSATNSLPTASDGYTIFLVATGDQPGDSPARAMQIGSSTGQSGRVVGADLSQQTGMRFNNGAAVYDVDMDQDAFHIFVLKVDDNMNYANATLYVDGTLAGNTFTGSSTRSNVTNFTGSTLDLILGRGRLDGGAATDWFQGDIAELLVYNDQMTELQINLVANYLATDYGLSFAYDTTTVVPEPASMGAIALFGIVAMRRRVRK